MAMSLFSQEYYVTVVAIQANFPSFKEKTLNCTDKQIANIPRNRNLIFVPFNIYSIFHLWLICLAARAVELGSKDSRSQVVSIFKIRLW